MPKAKKKSTMLLADANREQLKDALEELGYGVIIWSPEDFPSQEAFESNVDTVIDICIERGNIAISDMCDDEEEEEEGEDE